MATVTYLIVGGGGGGAAGGGGGGQVKSGSFSTSGISLAVTVGAGGTAGSDPPAGSPSGTDGGDGGTSSIATIDSAIGGGGGDGDGGGGHAGASGGGGTWNGSSGGVGSAGGNGGAGDGVNQDANGGGGGASGNVGGTGASNTGGAGGAGTSSSISGAVVTYGGGGGGGGNTGGSGADGGGNGGNLFGNGTAATANTGGGGGGAYGGNGAAGGSGIVIVRFPTSGFATSSGGSKTTSGSDTIHTFTANDTLVLTAFAPVTITPPTGSATLTGQAPTRLTGPQMAPPSGAIALLGAALSLSLTVRVAAGALALTGFAPSLGVGKPSFVTVPVGSVVCTGLAPGVRISVGVPAGALLITADPYPAQVLSDGAVGYWRLGDAVGSGTAADLVGGHTGTISGGVTLAQAGAISDGTTAALFDGSTGKILLGTMPSPAICSYEAWVKTTDGVTQSPILTNYAGGTAGLYFGKQGAKLFVYAPLFGSSMLSNASINTGAWVHVVVTHDVTTTRMYINGQFDKALDQSNQDSSATAWAIGFGNVTEWWPGSLQEVAFFGSVLTPAQIAAHYAQRVAPSLAPTLLFRLSVPVPTGSLVFVGLAPVDLELDVLAFSLELAGYGNGWTDVTPDLTSADIVVQRGFQSAAIDDLVAAPATLSIALNNSPSNSAGARGYYSPDHAAVRAGFDTGIRCRLDVTANNRPRTRFIGWIQAVTPLEGLYDEQTTAILASSWMQLAQGSLASSVGVQAAKRGDQLIASLVALATFPPPATQYATGLDTFPYAFDDLGPKSYVVDGFDSIAKSGIDRIYEKADGTLVYEARTTRQLGAGAALTITDVAPAGQPGLALASFPATRAVADVYSAIQVTVHPKSIDASAVVLYAYLLSASSASIAAGTSITILGPYQDPNQLAQLIGGINMLTAAGIGTSGSLPATDWQITTAPNGGGSDISSSCTVTVVYGATGATFTITNNSGSLGYISKLQCRGQGVYNYQTVVATATNSGTAAALGKKSSTVDCPYQALPTFAQTLANYLLYVYGVRRTSLTKGVSIFAAAEDEITQDQLLSLEVDQAIVVSETVTGLLNIFWINNIKETYDERMNVTLELQLAPMVVNPVPTGAIAFTGLAPTVIIKGISITVPTGSLTCAGLAPDVGNAPVWQLGITGAGELGVKTDLS